MGFFKTLKQKLFGQSVALQEKYQSGLSNSRRSFLGKMQSLFARYRTLDDEYFNLLEELLIQADIGARLSHEIIEATKTQARLKNVEEPSGIIEILGETMLSSYQRQGETPLDLQFAKSGPTVILMVGVNGSGKTTSIAKLTHSLQLRGKRVLLVAGDTFRAGAVEQLDIWAKRLKVELVHGIVQGDPASVIYDGIKRAKLEGYDVVICDTAGRLQTKQNLMQELAKIHRVIRKEIPDGPHEVLLVIDATTGQNGIYQARAFSEVTDVSGIVLTKMDGTSKGGIVLAIRDELSIPVRYIGLGEQMDDLIPFEIESYLLGMLGIDELKEEQ